jgi:Plant transposon protein
MALKLLAYGCSASAFTDYFQMGETTARECLLRLTCILSSHPDVTSVYLRSMTRAYTRRVSAINQEQHGIAGMIGSLDCMHVSWKSCPVAWQGHSRQGKETYNSSRGYV